MFTILCSPLFPFNEMIITWQSLNVISFLVYLFATYEIDKIYKSIPGIRHKNTVLIWWQEKLHVLDKLKLFDQDHSLEEITDDDFWSCNCKN